MKRFAVVFFAVASAFLALLAFLAGYLVIGGAALASLIALMMYSHRLETKVVAEKFNKKVKQYAIESEWIGAQLLLKPCWFKRLCFGAIWSGITLACLSGPDSFRALASEKPFSFVSLILAVCLFGYAAWITFAGIVREVSAGFSLKLDAAGFTLAGYPTMPWQDVYRAGHRWYEDKGITLHSLDLEFSAQAIRIHWPGVIRPLLLGPFAIVLPIGMHSGRFALNGVFLASPVPTIVTAICKIGSRYAPHSVVELSPHVSLDDARKLAVLWAKATLPIDPTEHDSAFSRAAAAFSVPGGVSDATDLEAAMAKFSRDLAVQTNALKDHSELSIKVTTERSEKFLKEMDRGAKILKTIFISLILLLTLYYALRWLLA